MKKLLIAFWVATAGVCATPAMASTITYDTRNIDVGVNIADYAASWAAQTSWINSNSLSDFNGTQPGFNAITHLNVGFSLGAASNFALEIGPDAGYGGALYLDGALVDYKTDDLWWGGSWNDPSELLLSYSAGLSAGAHTLDGFWAENCCNGGQGGHFSLDQGATWLDLTTANLDALAVSEPGALALLGLGFGGLLLSRRRRA